MLIYKAHHPPPLPPPRHPTHQLCPPATWHFIISLKINPQLLIAKRPRAPGREEKKVSGQKANVFFFSLQYLGRPTDVGSAEMGICVV